MVTITEEQWRWMLALALCGLVLLVGMFCYMVRLGRLAYLGERWVMAAGTYRRAARALDEFTLETEALVIQHAYLWPSGQVCHMNRAWVEGMIRLHPPKTDAGGPGL